MAVDSGEDEKQIDLDSVLKELGQFGRFQLLNYLLICLPILFSAIFTLSYVFSAGQLDYRCHVPQCERLPDNNTTAISSHNAAAIISEDFHPVWLPGAVPLRKTGKPALCERYRYLGVKPQSVDSSAVASDGDNDGRNACDAVHGFATNETEECDRLVYKTDERTIVNDFGVTCESQEWKLALVGTVNNIGQFVCLPLSGFISDRYGRRTILVLGIVVSGLMGLARSFAPNYSVFLLFEFLDPALGSGVYSAGFILGMELVGPSKRVLGGAIISCFYALGEALLGYAASRLHDWRVLLRALYGPALIFALYPFVIPESVRWLLHKGRTRQAIRVLTRAARVNGVVLSDAAMRTLTGTDTTGNTASDHNPTGCANDGDQTMDNGQQKKKIVMVGNNHEKDQEANGYLMQLQPLESADKQSSDNSYNNKNNKKKQANKDNRQYPLRTVLHSRQLLLRVANCSFCWLTNTFVYYGLSLNSVALSGDDKYMNFILVSLIEIPGYIVTYFLSNRMGRRSSLCGSLLVAGLACVTSNFVSKDLLWARLSLYLLGKFSITVSFTVLYVYTTELFPTSLRHSLLAACSMFGRLGSMLAPQTPLLARWLPELPMLMFGAFAIVSGLSILRFPETLDVKLPDTVREAEDIGRTAVLPDQADNREPNDKTNGVIVANDTSNGLV